MHLSKTVYPLLSNGLTQETLCPWEILQAFSGLPWSGKNVWKMKKFPGQGNVREFHFQSEKFRRKKKEKSQGIKKSKKVDG